MEILYHINRICPAAGQLGGHSFSVKLFPAWKTAVAEYGFTQERCNQVVKSLGDAWLAGCGFDPKIYGRPPTYAIRVTNGEWGPEHITVPGNACGLDLSDGIEAPRGGKCLLPHNVDSMGQAHLLIAIFSFFADCLVLQEQMKEFKLAGK